MADTEQKEVKNKTRKLFIVALIFALLAGLGTMIYLKVLEARLKARLTPPQKEMASVIVAKKDLPVGSVINTTTMSIRRVPRAYVNSDVFTPKQFDSIQGAILIKPLQSGKMLSQDFIDLNIAKDFAGTIRSGHRAVTIQVDEINSISGLIRPGNFIDLFTRVSSGNIRALASTQSGDVILPVLQDVLVLATDKISARPNEDEFKNMAAGDRRRAYNTLTLEVTPKEAALVAIAESRGNLYATLRNSSDTDGILFSKVTVEDLLAHSSEMLEASVNKAHNKELSGIHLNKKGQLVTRDGVVIKNPGLHLNKEGLLVTKDGTVLSGRNLIVGDDGLIRTKDGKLVDTASLVAGKNGILVDKNGTVLDSNGYTTAKGGFLVDKDGNVITPDGNVISGVTVGKDGRVRTRSGRVISAGDISVDKDGRVHLKTGKVPAMKLDKEGRLLTADGKPVNARDLVSVGSDGLVRSKDGKVLQGVTVGKDGQLYSADGKKMSAADVMMAEKGYTQNKNGTVTDKDGKVYTAKDLVTVARDGTVHTKDGTVLPGVHMDKDGKLHDKDNKLLTAADIVKRSEIAGTGAGRDELLAGVRAHYDPEFAKTLHQKPQRAVSQYSPYEVEYIVGGTSDGAAKSFTVQIEENKTKSVQKQ